MKANFIPGQVRVQIYHCTLDQVSDTRTEQRSHASRWCLLLSSITHLIWSHVSMGVVPPPNTQTVKNTRSSVVVNIICLGWDSVFRIAKAKAMAPRRPYREKPKKKKKKTTKKQYLQILISLTLSLQFTDKHNCFLNFLFWYNCGFTFSCKK